MNILVIDDEVVQVKSLKRGLRGLGHNVLESFCAEDALERIEDKSNKINIILTDYAMPGMNGIELLKRIREKNHSLPVVMMTAYGEKGLILDALHNQCDSFIEKPFTLDQLALEIERAEVRIIQNTHSRQLPEMIPNLIHQINNPLMSIMGAAELGMLQLDDAEAIRSRMEAIIRATEEIQELNKQVLNSSKKTDERLEEIEINELLNDCINLFKELILLKDITVEKDLPDHELRIMGHRFDLEQLFRNLILNAIDAMDGQPQKILKLSSIKDPENASALVRIQDTGSGIPRESLEKIFTSYFTDKENGTGLGLTVVQYAVEKHKGRIDVTSRRGEGATFQVTLPRDRDFPNKHSAC